MAALPLVRRRSLAVLVRVVLVIMALCFAGLIAVTLLAYRNAPPISTQVTDAAGAPQFSGDDTAEGQAAFLRYGLMANITCRRSPVHAVYQAGGAYALTQPS